jgi:prepilin-type N-terminal cleavage/methylation domain-containing protein
MRHTKRKAGFTLVEIMIVILIIAVLVAIAVPNFMQARDSSRQSSCITNLKYIDSRKEQFAMEAKLNNGDPVTWANIVPTYLKSQPSCAGGGTYTINVIGTNPTCSLSANGHIIP